MAFHVPNKYRIKDGPLGSDNSIGNNGAFSIKFVDHEDCMVIASDEIWEHVSVSHRDQTPSWDLMCKIKDMFWDDEDCVVQFHPPKSQYVNTHNFCLHLWRKVGSEFETPPTWMVGIK